MPERAPRAVELYTTTDMSVDDIANELGTSRTTVYTWLQSAGVSGQRRAPRTLAGPELERIVEGTNILLEGQRRVSEEVRAAQREILNEVLAVFAEHFTTQNERAAVWSASVNEMRRDLDRLQVSMSSCESTLSNLTGVVNTLKGIIEALIATRQPPAGPQLLSGEDQ